MSYILEALKKAQAERQLGNAPTIHAPQPVQAAPASAAASRKPLLVGVAAGVLVAAAVAAVALRHQAPVQVAAVSPAPAPAGPVSAAPAPAPAPAPDLQTAPVPTPPARQARNLPKAAPVAPPAALADPAPVRPRPQPAAPVEVHRAAPRAHPPATEPVPAQVPVPMAKAAPTIPASPAPAAGDNVRNLNELPEAIQREVPRVVFGGYIYSPNPADRLLLIDKMLRHEGDEVAPGLVLEKLTPKAAVMNYRGYRYRVAY